MYSEPMIYFEHPCRSGDFKRYWAQVLDFQNETNIYKFLLITSFPLPSILCSENPLDIIADYFPFCYRVDSSLSNHKGIHSILSPTFSALRTDYWQFLLKSDWMIIKYITCENVWMLKIQICYFERLIFGHFQSYFLGKFHTLCQNIGKVNLGLQNMNS